MATFRSTDWLVNKLIEDQGQMVTIYTKSIEVDGNGNVTSESYSDTIETRAWVRPRFASIHEEYDLYGFKNEGDYTMSLSNTVTINLNDDVKLNDGQLLSVREIVKQYEYDQTVYKEVLLRLESANY